jgi:hypothetical protein
VAKADLTGRNNETALIRIHLERFRQRKDKVLGLVRLEGIRLDCPSLTIGLGLHAGLSDAPHASD